MMTLDQLIFALTILRDNIGGQAPATLACGGEQMSIRQVTTASVPSIMDNDNYITVASVECNPKLNPIFNPNHYPDIDARTADDMRKLATFVPAFRQACIEFSRNRNLPFDPMDRGRFKRLQQQVVQTGRDIVFTLGHIEPDIGR